MSARRRPVALAALVMAVVVLLAQPASAHAVLLRTVPAPQSTVARAPGSVRLEFSERVDVALGAIRVYDVDARRVDTGTIRHASSGRMVIVPVGHLRNGTYTVTWRAVSADGHAVRGGFVFYVGAPSNISAQTVPEDTGASSAVGWLFGVARFLWFGALIVVLGALALRRWVWTPALAAAGASSEPANARFRASFRTWLFGGWAVLVIGGVARLLFEGASVAGLSLGRAARPSVATRVLDTTYGHLWRWEIAFALLLVVPIVFLTSPSRPPGGTQTWLAAAAAAGVALTIATARNGHARTDVHPVVATISIAIHVLALAVWVGGLITLLVVGRPAWRTVDDNDRPAVVRGLVVRFSRLAVVAVVVVVITGSINTWFNANGLSDLWRTTYGRTVLVKVGLLALALAFAARHLFLVPGRLANPDRARREVGAFTRSGVLEATVLTAVIAVAAGLIAMVPGRSLALAAQGPLNVTKRAGDVTVQVFIDDTADPAQLHVTFVDQSGLALPNVSDASATLAPATAPSTTQNIPLRLLSPGHYAGDVPTALLRGTGRRILSLTADNDGHPVATTVRFKATTPRGRRQKP
jgi:copper transport protein